MRRTSAVVCGGMVALSVGIAAHAQSVSVEALQPAGSSMDRSPVAGGGGARSELPLKTISLYKNGIAYFERAGTITGDALIHIDFTTAQLNDVLQSLTVTDLGGGTVAGLGYDNTATLGEQLRVLNLNLGPDPTVGEFLDAMKGKHVEIRGAGTVVTGKLLNVEVRPQTNPKTGERTERRFVSVITDRGALKTVELTPVLEVRLADSEERAEIGHYLQILATTHNPPMRHLTLETRGTGSRELRIGYIGAMPAWKSNYRVLVTGGAKAATLQGWAVVDNSSAQDWKDVRLTLVSGTPQSFIQPVSRPNNIQRPEISMGSDAPAAIPMRRAMSDPIDQLESSASVRIEGGLQISPKIPPPPSTPAAPPPAGTGGDTAGGYQADARKSLAPMTDAVALEDVFEYKLDKPMTIRAGESAAIPIVQTTVEAERVSEWLSAGGRVVQRALWLHNTSELTLDQGSFTLTEDGAFAGQGQIPLTHAGERRLAAYGQDVETKVSVAEAKEPPFVLTHLVIANGVLTGDHRMFKERDFNIENPGLSTRIVILGMHQSGNAPAMSPWELDTAAAETIGTAATNKMYRFRVEVAPHATQIFQVIESYSRPVVTPLTQLTTANFAGIIRESGSNPQVIALLQPLADAKSRLIELDGEMREQQRGMDEVNVEEARLRQNIALLKGSPEERPLAKRYADEMLGQEDKLASLRAKREATLAERGKVEKTLEDRMKTMQADLQLAKHDGVAVAQN